MVFVLLIPSPDKAIWFVSFFAIWQMVAGIVSLTSIVDETICVHMYGSICNPAETVYQNYNALWKLHSGALIGAILWTADSYANLPGSAVKMMLAMDLTGVVLFGPHKLNGAMTDSFHILAMIGQFVALWASSVLLDVQASPKPQDLKMVGTWYKNSYLHLITFYFGLWFFINTDASHPSEVVIDANVHFTPLAAQLWNWWSVAIFQLMVINAWTVRFGTHSQLYAVCVTTAVLQVVDIIVIFLLREYETKDILIKTNVSFTTMLVLAIAAIYKDQPSNNAKRTTKPKL